MDVRRNAAGAQALLSNEVAVAANSTGGVEAGAGGYDDDDLIQFVANLFFVKENEQNVDLHIVRFGDPSNACRARLRTTELSAKAGRRFEAVDKQLEFKEGEVEKHEQIRILQDNVWHTCEEFQVALSEPMGCGLARHSTCRVKIIDEDFFPSNRLRDEILADTIEKVPVRSLAFDFLRLVIGQPTLARKAALFIIIGLVHNLQYLVTIYLKVYLINVLLAKAADHGNSGSESGNGGPFGDNLLVPGSLDSTAVLVGAIYLIPFGFLYLLDNVKARLGVAGQIKGLLQLSLFRRYMAYCDSSRSEVSDVEVAMSSVHDIPEIVDNGFLNVFKCIQVVQKLIIVLIYLLTQNVLALVPFALYPILAAIFIRLRLYSFSHKIRETKESSIKVARSVRQACTDFQMIFDYKQRSHCVDKHSYLVQALCKAQTASTIFALNNGYFFPWLTTISMAVYVVVGVRQLEHGQTSVGTFVATFGIFSEVGTELQQGYDDVMRLLGAFEYLKPLTRMLNLATDDEMRMNHRRRLAELWNHARERLSEDGLVAANVMYKEDLIPIQLSKVSYQVGDKKIFESLDLTVAQGRLVAVMSAAREGKSTLLRLISQDLKHQGCVFIPPYLLTLQVRESPKLVPGSLHDNLVFGANRANSKLVALPRLRLICEKLGMSKELLLRVGDTQDANEKWKCGLTNTDRMLIHLARALVTDPNVLVVHRPMMRFFSHDMRERMVQALREFVHNRGIGHPSEREHLQRRRPRTVFFSSAVSQEAEEADVIWHIQDGKITTRTSERTAKGQGQVPCTM